MNIYCDEAGFTGDDLLEDDQPYFVYSSVYLDKEICAEIQDIIHENYSIQNGEVKGKNLVKRQSGRKVILHIFEKYSDRVKIVYHDKKFALACKMVECAIEPYFSDNIALYDSRMNRFLASRLYSSFMQKKESAREIFKDFVLLAMRKMEFEDSIFTTEINSDRYMRWMLSLIRYKPQLILKELHYNSSSPQSNWILDLTTTSLFSLLSEWSKNGDELEVICDDSKVFMNSPTINGFNRIGLRNTRIEFRGEVIGFNLKKEIVNKNSKDEFGLQVADIFSSTLNYCLKNSKSEFSDTVFNMLDKCICKSDCVMPETNPITSIYDRKQIELYHNIMDRISHQPINN